MSTMEYEEIFSHQGKAYHDAMLLCPDARKLEFERPLGFLELQDGATLVDFPSGGAYVRRFLSPSQQKVTVRAIEGIAEFAACKQECEVGGWDNLPVEEEAADGVLSLAALHHATQRDMFYSEVYRTLKPGGSFVIGDVEEGSDQGRFLNGFVNAFNSMGHQGVFLKPGQEEERMELCHR